ncbi:MAG: hypothetical protein C6I01_00325 [Epsilonproteobacteria bacterium]|nr:hypothetical protein [Campylobacterota bacterium]NPA89619.1 DUF58 domain-containing protein [Campylobacterota bacterium]
MPSPLKYLSSAFRRVSLKRNSPFYWIIVGLILLFGGAYVHNNNIIFLVMFFVASVGSVAILRGRFNLAPIEVSYHGKERFFAQTPGHLYLHLKSPRSLGIEIGDQFIPILAGEMEVKYPLYFSRRGKFKLCCVKVTSTYPFYLATFQKIFPLPLKEIVVYPTPKGKEIGELLGKGGDFSGERGDFDGVREYREGDSVRDIHWGSVAKGTPMAKRFEIYTPQRELLLDYDSLSGSKEERLSQLTKWVLQLEEKNYPFKLKLGTQLFHSSLGIEPILQALALY